MPAGKARLVFERDSSSEVATGSTIVVSGQGSSTELATLDGYHASDFLSPRYLTLQSDNNLTQERVFTPGYGLDGTDVGAGSTYGLSLHLQSPSGLDLSAGGLALADGVAGAGLSITGKVLAVGAGDGISVAADAVKVALRATDPGLVVDASGLYLGTPGTLSVTSANEVTGSTQYHAITTSYNPGASASILASSAQGYLELVRMGLNVAPSFPLHARGGSTQLRLDQDVDNYVDFTLSGSGDLTIAPSGNDIFIPKPTTHESSDWASRTTGWGIYPETKHGRSGYADFRYIYADELHVTRFIADMEQALAGGQVITKSVAKLVQDFTIPAKGSSADLYVEDLPGTTANVFQDGDWVRIRNVSRSGGGLVVADAYGTVTFVSHTAASGVEPGYQQYTFSRPASDTGSAAASTVVLRGGLVLDYGVTGDGYYEVTTLDQAGSPYAQIATWATHPQNKTERTRLGQLNGLGVPGIGDEWGLWAGQDENHYIALSDQHALIVGLKQQWISGDVGNPIRGEIDPNATGTSSLFWLGPSAGDKRLTVQADGVVLFGTVPSGNVAGWAHASDLTKIDGGDIYAGSVTADKFNAHGMNMLGNPGFELGIAADWNQQSGGIGISSAAHHSGAYCAFRMGSGTNIWPMFQQCVVEAGRNYYLGGWVAMGSGSGTLGYEVYWLDANSQQISSASALITTPAAWTRVSNIVQAPSNARYAVFYATMRSNCDASTQGLWDDAEFYLADGAVLVGAPGGARVEINQNGIEGYSDSTTKQFYLRTSDGRAMFGDGRGIIGANGVSIRADDTGTNDASAYTFRAIADGTTMGGMWAWDKPGMQLTSVEINANSSCDSHLQLISTASSSHVAHLHLGAAIGGVTGAEIWMKHDPTAGRSVLIGNDTYVTIADSLKVAKGLNVGTATGAGTGETSLGYGTTGYGIRHKQATSVSLDNTFKKLFTLGNKEWALFTTTVSLDSTNGFSYLVFAVGSGSSANLVKLTGAIGNYGGAYSLDFRMNGNDVEARNSYNSTSLTSYTCVIGRGTI